MDPAAFATAKLRPDEVADLRWEETAALILAWNGAEPEAAQASSRRRGSARVSGRTGSCVAAVADLGQAVEALRRAASGVRRLATTRTPIPPAAPHVAEYLDDSDDDPFDGVPVGEKAEVLAALQHQALTAHPRIEGATLYYREQDARTVVLTSEGSHVVVRQRELVLQLTVHAGGDRRGVGTVSLGAGASFAAVRSLAAEVDRACRTAVELTQAPAGPQGRMDVVLTGPIAGVWAHETIGHLSEADHVIGDPRLADELRPGRQVAGPQLSICDGPGLPGTRGYVPVDDEATVGRVIRLVDQGRLGERAHSRASAAELGAEPTGNGRAVGVAAAPIPRLRTTWIEPGTDAPEDIVAGTERGLLVDGVTGGQTDRLGFVLMPVACRLIEDGEVTTLVRPVTLSGDVLAALGNVDRIGSQLDRRDISASCGKQGQWPLPVSCWAPMIRIHDVQVTPG